MPKQSPIPGDLDRPFWDACNQGRLVIQCCAACGMLQHPPQPTCLKCGSADNLEWRQMSGRGRIRSYNVVYDTPVTVLVPEQPFNLALIELKEDPGINFLSHLPGTPVDEVPVGATVEVVFETTPGTGQKVPEWRVVG